MSSEKEPLCVLDEQVLNHDTISSLRDIGITFFASLCGRNRGVFVLQPSDGQTYSCLSMPYNLASLAGITDVNYSNDTDNDTDTNSTDSTDIVPITFKDANDIKNQYIVGNITGTDAIAVLNYFVQAVYWTSANVNSNVYGCELSGLSTLINCPYNPIQSILSSTAVTTTTISKSSKHAKITPVLQLPIRSVTMAGVFIPSEYVGTTTIDFELLMSGSDSNESFYTINDFYKMKQYGINTVQIPFPIHEFLLTSKESLKLQYLQSIFNMIQTVGDLQVIVSLKLNPPTMPNLPLLNEKDISIALTNAAQFCIVQQQSIIKTSIVAITIPQSKLYTNNYIQIIRSATTMISATYPKLHLFVPIDQGDIIHPLFDSSIESNNNVYASLELDHSITIDDIASSSSFDDRNKMYYHESKACIYRSPLEFSSCYYNIPIFISHGFDISIDNCINSYDTEDIDTNSTTTSTVHIGTTKQFINYGQCERFSETIHSKWWYEHRISFLKRQMFSYEQGLGWSYTSWKLYNDVSVTNPLLDIPAKLLSYSNIISAGIVTSFDDTTSTTTSTGNDACLNPPENDFVMGDATYNPTPAPVPNCYPGWWNTTINDCTYWIPPPTTDTPSPEPKIRTIYIEQTLSPTIVSDDTAITTASTSSNLSVSSFENQYGNIALYGIIGIIIGFLLSRFLNKSNNRRQSGYSEILE